MKHAPHLSPLFLSVAALIFLALGFWYIAAQLPAPEPAKPLSDRPALRPDAAFLNASASVDYYLERLAKQPDVVENYVALAQVYLQEAQATAQEELYIPRAERMLAEALEREPTNYHARVLQASLFNTLHQFEEARDLAQSLIAEHPRHAYVYGILVDALVELGAYEAAVEACDDMIALRPNLASYARASYLRELHGDGDGAIEAMRMAANAGVVGRADRAWALYQLGNLYLADADVDTAERIFNGMLEERSNDAFAVAGLGHVALVRSDYDEAIALLREAYTLAPSDAFLELLAEAYAATGNERALNETVEKIQLGLLAAEDMGENVRMEYADFLADQDTMLDKALSLARTEYKRRPNHLHALETYAWALYKNGDARAAVPLIEQALRLGTGDAMVHYRAATIYYHLGQTEPARYHFEQALSNNLLVESPATADLAASALRSLVTS